MSEQLVRVECHSGLRRMSARCGSFSKGRPWRLRVEDRWYSPGATYFRVLTTSGDRYVLRHVDAQEAWSLTAFRAAGKRVDTKINQGV
jgi:hypothetical protein